MEKEGGRREFLACVFGNPVTNLREVLRTRSEAALIGKTEEGTSEAQTVNELRMVGRRRFNALLLQIGAALSPVGIWAVKTVLHHFRFEFQVHVEDFESLGLAEKTLSAEGRESTKGLPPKIADINARLEVALEGIRIDGAPAYKDASVGSINPDGIRAATTCFAMQSYLIEIIKGLAPGNEKLQEVMNFLNAIVDGHSYVEFKRDFSGSVPFYSRYKKKASLSLPTNYFSKNFFGGLIFFLYAQKALIWQRADVAEEDEGEASTAIDEIASKNAFELANYAADNRLKKDFQRVISEFMDAVSEDEFTVDRLKREPVGMDKCKSVLKQVVIDNIFNKIFGENVAEMSPDYLTEVMLILLNWVRFVPDIDSKSSVGQRKALLNHIAERAYVDVLSEFNIRKTQENVVNEERVKKARDKAFDALRKAGAKTFGQEQ